MKKNLITVIILALCLINLVFNILLVFVFMPSASKTNKLIKDISACLDLEIQSQTGDDEGVSINDLVAYKLEQGNPINLASTDGSDTLHMLQYGLSINLDKNASDFTKVNETLEASQATIYDTVGDIIGRYNYNQVVDVKIKKQIRDEILLTLQEKFETKCIYSIDFYNYIAQ